MLTSCTPLMYASSLWLIGSFVFWLALYMNVVASTYEGLGRYWFCCAIFRASWRVFADILSLLE